MRERKRGREGGRERERGEGEREREGREREGTCRQREAGREQSQRVCNTPLMSLRTCISYVVYTTKLPQDWGRVIP